MAILLHDDGPDYAPDLAPDWEGWTAADDPACDDPDCYDPDDEDPFDFADPDELERWWLETEATALLSRGIYL